MWEYVARPEAADRVASFTSVSGPSADHFSRYVRDGLKRPYRPKLFARALSQAAHLSYMAAFSVPVLAPALMRAAAAPLKQHADAGVFPSNSGTTGRPTAADAANGLKIYRANFFHSLLRVRNDRYVEVPVQLIVNLDDPYVRPYVYDDTARWAPRLWRRDIRAKHWSPFSHPQVLAAAVTELAEHLDGKPASRALLRAQVNRPRKQFGDTLVSVTGAGSGIGRETALLFARLGAEVVVSDLNEAGVKKTAADITARGGVAHSYVLDVVRRRGRRGVRRAGLPRARRARHRGEQRRHRPGGLIPGHPRARSGIGCST